MMYINKLPLKKEKELQFVETTPYGIEYVNALHVPDTFSNTRKVCIVDSGYDVNHPDLPSDPALITGESFVNGFEWNTDESSHGTHVAGTIVALGGNDMGVTGVIRNGSLRLHISKVFDASGSTSTSTVLAGFESCVKAESNVINMSLGGGGFDQAFADAIADAYSFGILTFASSGNSYDSALSYPASYRFVTSVASITKTYERSLFSSYNDQVDLCAPGSEVLSTVPGGSYAIYSGTSMACPHVAGVAALVWSYYPQLQHDKLRKILEETATNLPLGQSDGYDVEFGHGLVNALEALELVKANIIPTMSPIPSITPSLSQLPSTSSLPSSGPTLFCPNGVDFNIIIFTDEWPDETSWTIRDANDIVVMESDRFTLPSTVYEKRSCLPLTDTCGGSDYSFTIYDSHGDGLCCEWGQGYYRIVLEGEEISSGRSFASSETTSLCRRSRSPTTTPSLSMVPSISSHPSLSSSPSYIPSLSFEPSSTPSAFCLDSVLVKVNIYTDNFPDETSWDIKNDKNVVVQSSSNFTRKFSMHEEVVCLSQSDFCKETSFAFTIYDSWGDGLCCEFGDGFYEVYVNGEKVGSGSSFESSETLSLCGETKPPKSAASLKGEFKEMKWMAALLFLLMELF